MSSGKSGKDKKEMTPQASSGDKKSYVVAGAILSCSYGSQPSRMGMQMSHGVYVKGKPIMNVMDHIPNVNIMPFGTCGSMQNPAVAAATAAKGGLPQRVPCTPMVMMPWLGGKTDKLVDNNPSLLNDSTNMCMFCGQIKVEDDGQNLDYVQVIRNSDEPWQVCSADKQGLGNEGIGGIDDGTLYGVMEKGSIVYGPFKGEGKVYGGMASASGSAVFGTENHPNGTKIKGGHIAQVPGMDIRGGAKASAFNAVGSGELGDKNLGVAAQGQGDLLTGSAYGAFVVRPEQRTVGFRAGAEAAVVSGEAALEFKVFGYSVQIGVEGSLLSVGAKADMIVEEGRFKTRAKVAAGLGAGISISIGEAD
ncbi:hypothetical protein J27TS7_32060 [Paenibacillus dendritiformis]|uniref:DUF4280 domain-containing protein n=1 Tax=Paenibacillus dendritiformis TaxID=130049 RepID=UPI001B2CCB6F|nr:DUF4280 domain-containing protein [Paenibacillus dendritiformis]GIO73692.1 hypothetical protein J27TS7_32060 [Paenibacillus dendritiformis]